MAHYWPKGGAHKGLRGINAAVCHAADHAAPDWDLHFAGSVATEALLELLKGGAGSTVPRHGPRVCWTCTELSPASSCTGRLLPGVDFPTDDPKTTWERPVPGSSRSTWPRTWTPRPSGFSAATPPPRP